MTDSIHGVFFPYNHQSIPKVMKPTKPRFNTLDEWLVWQDSLHWTTIDLGLDRLRDVANKMQLFNDLPFTIITVGGTNGKGSTVAMLDAILQAEGYMTGAYTSPYLYRYNERIKISGEECSDDLICLAFEAIDLARGDTSLTYFEFATLAAIWVFKQQGVQVAILEVGMGGRLDAVNCWDADAAIITSIGVDHVQWLGDNREDIGYEKSGIMRQNRPVISGDRSPPQSIEAQAQEKNAKLLQAGKHFIWKTQASSWSLSILSAQSVVSNNEQQWLELPYPALQGDFQINNAAVAITALLSLSTKLEISTESLSVGLRQVKLAGRLEQIQARPDVILDVAHNAHAAKELANWLSNNSIDGKTYALFSMLADKDAGQVVRVLSPVIDQWFVSTVDDPRGLAPDDLVLKMTGASDKNSSRAYKNSELKITPYNTLKVAWETCEKEARQGDRIIVFGSFLVLSEFKVIY